MSDLPIAVASEVDNDHGDLEAAPTQRNGYRPLAVDEVCHLYLMLCPFDGPSSMGHTTLSAVALTARYSRFSLL